MTTRLPLEGKTALVSGALGALGRVVAAHLSEQGARVWGMRTPGPAPLDLPAAGGWVECDVTDEASVRSAWDAVERQERPVDILVNTVGGYAGGRLEDLAAETWDRMMQLNLRSAFLITREALRRMGGHGGGRVVHIAAMTALRPRVGTAAYAASKAGVVILTEVAAAEGKGRGVLVNAIAPGTIDTPANRADMPKADRSLWVQPREIATIVCALCGPEGAGVTGTVVKMAGGS